MGEEFVDSGRMNVRVIEKIERESETGKKLRGSVKNETESPSFEICSIDEFIEWWKGSLGMNYKLVKSCYESVSIFWSLFNLTCRFLVLLWWAFCCHLVVALWSQVEEKNIRGFNELLKVLLWWAFEVQLQVVVGVNSILFFKLLTTWIYVII